jgi:hypothetical protein
VSICSMGFGLATTVVVADEVLETDLLRARARIALLLLELVVFGLLSTACPVSRARELIVPPWIVALVDFFLVGTGGLIDLGVEVVEAERQRSLTLVT